MIFQNPLLTWMILREILLMLKTDSKPLKDFGLASILKDGVSGNQTMSCTKVKVKSDIWPAIWKMVLSEILTTSENTLLELSVSMVKKEI